MNKVTLASRQTARKLLGSLLVAILFVLCFGSNGLSAQSNENIYAERAFMITKNAQKYHYKARPIDSTFSELVFIEVTELLDPQKLYFTSTAIDQLSQEKRTISNQIINKEHSFLSALTKSYEQRLLQTKHLLTNLENKQFVFSETAIMCSGTDNEYLDDVQLIDKWNSLIQAKLLFAYYSKSDSARNCYSSKEDAFNQLKLVVIAREKCKIQAKLESHEGIAQFTGNLYLKSIASSFDPHTNYFTPAELNNFEDALAKERLSFGFDLIRNDNGEIEVSHIIPGSPAWISNQLNEGDVLLTINTGNETIDNIDCTTLAEVLNTIHQESVKSATFRFKKKNGMELSVFLSKKEIETDKNVIQSFILEGDCIIGYIYLPSFYTDDDQRSYLPNACANDFAKELIRLKYEGIEGLILDLRNNGGGSMLEAIRMAGIFIDYGALGIIHTKDMEPETIKDIAKGTIFRKPLLIMVNNFSASASELFTGAMQDYNRAVVVGSKTFGKSSSQNILALEAFQKESNTSSKSTKYNNGYLKITTSMFYRVDGKSHQNLGIIPDISLPNIFSKLAIGENSYRSALDTSSVTKKTYYRPLKVLPLAYLNEQSKKRVQSDSAYRTIELNSLKLLKYYHQDTVPLNASAFETFYQNRIEYDNSAIDNNTSLFQVSIPNYIINFNQSSNADQKQLIETDVYIKESYNILHDLINHNNK